MTRRMSRGRDNGYASVANYVTVPFQFGDGMPGLEPGLVVGAGPFVFGFLYVEHCRRKHLDIPDMVGMGVRDRHGLDVSRRDTKLIELSRQRLWPAPEHGLWIRWRKAIRHGRDRIRYPGIPQEPALCVFDQIAVVDEVHGFAFVDSRRPARNIAGDAFTAIENVKFFDAGLARLRQGAIGGIPNGRNDR